MSREKQIEEMQTVINGAFFEDFRNGNGVCIKTISEHLYNAGYRKQSENVIELPCKVGQTVYMPWEWNGQKGVAHLKVTTISNILDFGWSCGTDFDTDDDGYADKYNYGRFKFADIGKTVFLTREEAEEALAKMRKEDENGSV